jgi:UDP-GlcNAc:undecaprenyl-phosphate GlcNAc-1-phosphate transferase
MPFLIVFLISFMLSLLLTPLSARLGLWRGMADEPGGRRRHARRIARTGGIAIFISFVVGILITPLLDLPRTDPNEFTRMGGVLIGLTIVFAFGLLDDKFEFRPGLQFVAQAIASS